MKLGKITIAAVGKLKKDHWRNAQADYVKRLKRYTQLTVIEVRDYIGKQIADEVALSREGSALLDASRQVPFRIALDIQGQIVDSLSFADILRKWIENYSHIAFLIGGPVGLSEEAVQLCQYSLSLSAMTFPHEMARIILLEQLYRAATIINRHQYHK